MSLTTQWTTLLLMFASGAVLGLFLDIYRVLTDRFMLRRWSIPIFDLFFWMISACFVFGVLLWSNWGEMRFYIMVAIIAGILFYLRLLTKPVTRCLVIILRVVERCIKTLIQLGKMLIYRPVILLTQFLWRLLKMIALFIWTIFSKLILWITNPIISFVQTKIAEWKKSWFKRKKGE